jgi:Holliday junction DNA helicase RuvA
VIARLEGVLAEKSPEIVALDVHGVGYEVRVPLSTYFELPDEGKTVRLHIHTHVREDALQLYGFGSEGERVLFRLLIATSGVGPKLALAILSGLPASRLVAALRTGDLAALTGIPGVGKKTAERMVIDLREKALALEVSTRPERPPAPDAAAAAESALTNLGYPRPQAERAVRRALEVVPEGAGLETLIKEALRAAAG